MYSGGVGHRVNKDFPCQMKGGGGGGGGGWAAEKAVVPCIPCIIL